jgi:alginate O-acetyltransferase complex protein AlgI
MIFGDPRFFAILAGCWVCFFAVRRERRSVVLASWSLVFYAVFAWMALPLLLGLTGMAFIAARLEGRFAYLTVGVIALPLAAYKWGTDVTGVMPVEARGIPAIIPLGLSFLAFELIHFVIERHRGRVPAARLADLLAFAFFFPCRIAGPIKRYPAFAASLVQAEASFDDVYAGVVRIAIGFLKKFLVADVLALTAAEVSYATTPWHVWKAVLAFGLQLYVDFSAYSDVAIGASRVLGIRVPENFERPYLSRNIREFWSRWHMSLSSWVRDYVFTPVGRQLFTTSLRTFPGVIAAASYLSAFLVVGAWHGLTGNFLIWGFYHGMLLTAHYLYVTTVPEIPAGRLSRSGIPAAIGGLLTFVLVTVGWVPFMTSTLPDAARLLRIMLAGA